MQSLTLYNDEMDYHDSPQAEQQDAAVPPGNPAMVVLGWIVVLAIIWFIGQRSEAVRSVLIDFNPLNVIAIGLLAATFILLGKWLFVRFPVPGVTQAFVAI
jgi:hypothetical protein